MELKIDLEWGDEGVVPETVHPDTAFIFTKMAQVIQEMVAPKIGEKVLDVGCGRAMDALELGKQGVKAIGVDPSNKMMSGAKSYLDDNGGSDIALVRGIGEALPFKKHSLDKIICKGALDHFADPPQTMADMSQALKPGGAAIIAIANFESLSCRLGRNWFPIAKRLFREQGNLHPWIPPADHNYRFDCPILKKTVAGDFEIKKIRGMSLLWTAPYWGKFLSLLPPWASSAILAFLDKIACLFPSLSDVIIIRVTPRGN
jgi:ubiquinone/menaquinone biosynthesis C-methylase UbiE